jgi:DUF1365 family protein
MNTVDHIVGETFHGRRGDIRNAFRYSIDYVLLDAERSQDAPLFFGRNGAGLMSVHDSDHGGPPKNGRGAIWVREVLENAGIAFSGRIYLLTQPRVLGHVFNPVSFWLCYCEGDHLQVVIAEVTNTFGDRHSYLCHNDDLSPITGGSWTQAKKVMHVSPFQPIEGDYKFRFAIDDAGIAITINYGTKGGGVVATLSGSRRTLTGLSILSSLVRRPFGSRRVLGLIHWQALKLWIKGALYRRRPQPPETEISR